MNADTLLVLALLGSGISTPPPLTVYPAVRVSEPVAGWFAEDKLKHFFASFVVSSLSAGAIRATGFGRSESVAAGAGVAAVAGLMKERQDARGGGVFSGADLVWDAAGVVAAVVLLQAAE